MTKPVEITVNSRKYDGKVRRSWTAGLISANDDKIVLVGRFDRCVEHREMGHISHGTVSFEYFWTARRYNVFVFLQPDGSLRNYYCNITLLPTMSDGVLDYVDMDIDVVLWPDGKLEVLDLDEFAERSVKYGYSEEAKADSLAALNEVKAMIERREFPFDR